MKARILSSETCSPIHVETQLRLARAYAASKVPFFSEALFAAKLVVTAQLPALAAIDASMRVYFNPMLVDELIATQTQQQTIQQLAWVWVHEVSHAMRDHRSRAIKLHADPRDWNIAADIEINDNNFTGLTPPTCYPPVTHHDFNLEQDHLAEYYYAELTKKNFTPAQRSQFLVDEGSGVHGNTRHWEASATQEEFPVVSSAQQAGLRLSIAENLVAASRQSFVPAGWLRWADVMLPKIDWRQALRRRIQRSITDTSQSRCDYSYRVPNRRANAYAPFVRPSLRSRQQRINLAVVVDTSGSMDQRQLCRCMSEVRGILEATQCAITAIACDAQAYEPIGILTQSDVVVASQKLRGGGGTDMVVGIEAALGLFPKPDAIVVLTDGFTPFPPKPYARTPVIFGIIELGGWYPAPRPSTPPWQQSDVIMIPIS